MSRETLFAAEGVRARELAPADIPLVQRFFDQNPEYWLAVNGQPPPADLAQLEFDERPPPHLPCERTWFCGLFDDAGQLIGLCNAVAGSLLP